MGFLHDKAVTEPNALDVGMNIPASYFIAYV